MQQDLLKSIREQKKNPLPTPRVGQMVIWYQGGRKDEANARPAVVYAREMPGKLCLRILDPMFNALKKGVHWMGHPIHQNRSAPATVHGGSWDYLDHDEPAPWDYELHLDQLSRREAAVIDEERRQREAADVSAKIRKEVVEAAK